MHCFRCLVFQSNAKNIMPSNVELYLKQAGQISNSLFYVNVGNILILKLNSIGGNFCKCLNFDIYENELVLYK